MRNFTPLLLISFVLFSCSKHNEGPGGSPGSSPTSPATKPPAPVTTLTILVNDTVMNITSFSFERHGTGIGGGMTITASNGVQKVTAETFNFYQQNPWNMIYQEQVSYFTRTDGLSDWGGNYTRPVPRDDQVAYNDFMPLADSVVTGSFSASFNGAGGIAKEGQVITVKGNFKLVFAK